jgi:hypothetical protein
MTVLAISDCLRSHVKGSACNLEIVVGLMNLHGLSEITQFDDLFIDEYVVRFEIAMYDFPLEEIHHCLYDLSSNLSDFIFPEGSFNCQESAEVEFCSGHDNPYLIVLAGEFYHFDDVGVFEFG